MQADNDIFISYVSADREWARLLNDDLEQLGYKIWWDRKLHAGADYAAKIDHELRAAKAVIVLWSPESITSRWVLGEAETAADSNKLIPLLLENTDPTQLPAAGLRAVQCIPYSDRKGLQLALDDIMQRPAISADGMHKLQRAGGRIYRKVHRAITPVRLGLFLLLVFVAVQMVRDAEGWYSIDGSTNPGDYQSYLDSRSGVAAFLPTSRYYISKAIERLRGHEDIEPIAASLSAADFERFAQEHPDSMFFQFANIRANRLRQFESGTYKAVLKDSGWRLLLAEEIDRLKCGQLWLARNEIYYRLGRCFTTHNGIEKFKTNDDCPKKCATRRAINAFIEMHQSRLVLDNIERLAQREKDLGCKLATSLPPVC